MKLIKMGKEKKGRCVGHTASRQGLCVWPRVLSSRADPAPHKAVGGAQRGPWVCRWGSRGCWSWPPDLGTVCCQIFHGDASVGGSVGSCPGTLLAWGRLGSHVHVCRRVYFITRDNTCNHCVITNQSFWSCPGGSRPWGL